MRFGSCSKKFHASQVLSTTSASASIRRAAALSSQPCEASEASTSRVIDSPLRRCAPRNDEDYRSNLHTRQRMRVRILAARCVRGLRHLRPSQEKRAQGKPGARCTRGLVCKVHKRKRTRAYRFSGGNPAFPAQWFYGLLRALPGDRLSCHRRLRRTCFSRNLAPASGRQDHTTSPSAISLRSSFAAIASTASHRAFVTLRNAPLIG